MPIVTSRRSPSKQHLVEHDLGADVGRYLFYFQFFAGADAILLAAGLDDRIHVNPASNCIWENRAFYKNARSESKV